MNEILPTEYEVTVNPDGDILSIRRGNMSIPPAIGNRHYEEFLIVDTDDHLCPRVLAHEYTDKAKKEAFIGELKRELSFDESGWWLLEDSQLDEQKTITAKQYRKAIMDLAKEPDLEKAKTDLKTIQALKPAWDLGK